MTRIRVNTANFYDIVIENNFDTLLSELAKVITSQKLLIVTDSNVFPLYLNEVKTLLSEKYSVDMIVLQAGEQSKNLDGFMSVINAMEKAKLTRNDTIIALGGGVVGDITGFAAATYLRGINFVQIPTTLLADIDSSIGGKTGINLNSGKNLLGAFYQPKLVFVNLQTLKTLNELDWKNGIGEAIKYAVLNGGEIFEILRGGLEESNLENLIELCIKAKRDIVEKDTLELGQRRLLNLGHTFGHAIEKLSFYKVPHGIAVAKGLILALKASKCLGLDQEDIDKVNKLCAKYEIDTSVDYTLEEMAEIIKSDKKMDKLDVVNFVFVEKIGSCVVKKISIGELVKRCK